MNRLNITGYSVSEYTQDEKKRVMSFHKHNTLELSYVVSGNLIFSCMDKQNEIFDQYVFSKQLLLIAPQFTHKTSIPNSLKSIGTELSLSGGGNVLDYLCSSAYVNRFPESKKLIRSLTENGFVIIHDTENVEYRLGKLQRYINQKEMTPITEAKYELDLKRLLLEILTCKQASSKYSGSIHIKRAVSLLENNHTKKITVVSVANDLGLSVSYLQHLFKSETGMSMKQKLNDIRITHAQRLITDTNYSISKIAADVGYNSVQELNVNFKKKVGCTPSEFKKSKNEKTPMRYFNYDYSYDEKVNNDV